MMAKMCAMRNGGGGGGEERGRAKEGEGRVSSEFERGRETRVRSLHVLCVRFRAYKGDDIATRYCGKQTQVKADISRASTG